MKKQKNAHWIFSKKRGIARKFLQVGSISHATLRSGDILENFYDHFSPSGYRCPKGLAANWKNLLSYRQWIAGTFKDEFWNDEPDGNEELNRMFFLLDDWAIGNNYLLPYHYIGANDGDGSDFGIWPNWQTINDGYFDGIPVFNELPDVLPMGDCIYYNERGNVTYYRNRRELFSYV